MENPTDLHKMSIHQYQEANYFFWTLPILARLVVLIAFTVSLEVVDAMDKFVGYPGIPPISKEIHTRNLYN